MRLRWGKGGPRVDAAIQDLRFLIFKPVLVDPDWEMAQYGAFVHITHWTTFFVL